MKKERSERKSRTVILVVDDEPRNLQVVGNVLREAGYEVAFSKDGRQAIETARKILPHLILLDVMMPEMDGYEVIWKIKRDVSLSSIPVIFLTAKSEPDDIVKGFEMGGVDYVPKPFCSKELLARVDTHVRLHQLRSLISMCSYCRKVKNEDGSWEDFETFFTEKTGSTLSHGICPECMKKTISENTQPVGVE